MTKRILSVLLALVLVLAMSTVALADNTYTLTIKDEATGRTYEAYQVFAGDLSRNEATNEDVLVNIVWGSGVVATDGLIEGKTAAQWEAALKNKEITAKAFADMIANHLSGTKETSSAGDKCYTFDLPAGYYFVKETTTPGATDDAVSAYILNMVKTTSVNTKRSDVPLFDKEQTGDGTYDVGEIITFTLTSNIPSNKYDEYDSYYFEFSDTMSDGLSFIKVESVKVAGEDSTAFTFTEDGQNLKWVCQNTKADNVNIAAGSEIVITYTAKLNSNAISTEAEENTAKVIYSNNPENGGKGETTPDTELVYMIDIKGLKIDGNTQATLDGAEFVLLQGSKYYKVDASTKEVTWVDSETDATKVTTGTDGVISFPGLDAGSYLLRETKAPTGYNKLDEDITIVITATETNGVINFTASGADGVAVHDKAVELTVENNAGTTLPSTGGMGTTIFYVIGGLLMAAAVVLLVAKKRTVNE